MKKESIRFYNVDANYLKYLRKYDSKVSLKDNRSFIGVIIKLSNKQYCIPLTSKVRTKNGKVRNNRITTFVKNKKKENISCLLYNNMIPVFENVLSDIDFSQKQNSYYYIQEYIFIKTNFNSIQNKANIIYKKYLENRDTFLVNLCCNYPLLEEKSYSYKEETKIRNTDKEIAASITMF